MSNEIRNDRFSLSGLRHPVAARRWVPGPGALDLVQRLGRPEEEAQERRQGQVRARPAGEVSGVRGWGDERAPAMPKALGGK